MEKVTFQIDYDRVLESVYALSALEGSTGLRTTADGAALRRMAESALAELAVKLSAFVDEVDEAEGRLVLRDVGASAVTLRGLERAIEAALKPDAARFDQLAAELLTTLRRRYTPRPTHGYRFF